jgi:1-acyl-sn-glycerol-3-phosphate acyltransferase
MPDTLTPVYTELRPLAGWRRWRDIGRFYWWWYFNRIYTRILFRIRVEGYENIPISGAAVLASNHLSFLDGNILSAASPRRISFMIAKEWYEAFGVNWMCRLLGCIPVNRSGQDLAAVKGALKALSQGALLGCFPEGGISTSGEMRESKLGVALLVLKSGCPVIPVRLAGYRFQSSLLAALFLPKRVSAKIGRPLVFEGEDAKNRESLERVAQAISDAIRDLGGCEEG